MKTVNITNVGEEGLTISKKPLHQNEMETELSQCNRWLRFKRDW